MRTLLMSLLAAAVVAVLPQAMQAADEKKPDGPDVKVEKPDRPPAPADRAGPRRGPRDQAERRGPPHGSAGRPDTPRFGGPGHGMPDPVEVFRRLDRNNDKQLSVEEFAEGMKRFHEMARKHFARPDEKRFDGPAAMARRYRGRPGPAMGPGGGPEWEITIRFQGGPDRPAFARTIRPEVRERLHERIKSMPPEARQRAIEAMKRHARERAAEAKDRAARDRGKHEARKKKSRDRDDDKQEKESSDKDE